MQEELNIIWILAIGLSCACLLGYVSQYFKVSPILGYLLAGYLIGPNSPGYVANIELSEQLANIGVTLLMFAIGLQFSWKDLISVKQIALPGALVLAVLSISLGFMVSLYSGESVQASLLIGIAICVSSTVVIVRVLTDQKLLLTPQGHIVVGWTIVEDLISILALLLLPSLAQPLAVNDSQFSNIFYSILIAGIKIAGLGLIIYFIGERLVETILRHIARTRSNELFTLAILAIVFMIAIGSSYVFGVSLALGAFIAGTVIGKTDVSHQAAANALPMRDAFAVIFFLSVGMLINPPALMENLPLLLGILLIILFIKPILAFSIIRAMGYPSAIALTVALAISQIGEYSFILAEEGSRLKIIPDNAYDILIACSLISIALNPLLFQLFKPFLASKTSRTFSKITSEQKHQLSTLFEYSHSPENLQPKAIVVGYGPVGQMAVRYLQENNYRVLIIDQNVDTVISLKESRIDALFGDAAQPHLMERANLDNTQCIVITTADFNVTKAIIHTVQHLNSYVKIIARVRFKADLQHFKFLEVPIICDEEASSKSIAEAISKFIQSNKAK